MGENTRIEWADHTFNPWIGCTKVSPACDHCYAETLATNRLGVAWGPHAKRRRTAESTWRQPLAWNRRAEREGRRFRVFCASLADVFDNQVPAEWREDLWALIHDTPHLDWLLLTKRPQNIWTMLPGATTMGVPAWGNGWPNVWLGTTVENQVEANRRVPHLLAVPAAKRFLSMEPLLGPVRLARDGYDDGQDGAADWLTGRRWWVDVDGNGARGGSYVGARIDWVIAGGESGPKARPSHPDWFRSLRDQCEAARVSFFMKQMWGTTKAKMPPIPDDLMIRELPNA
jgi:protein gp37